MKRLYVLFAGLTVLSFAFAQTASALTNRYVFKNNASPLSPYTNWPDAATNIQDAINVCSSGDVVWVTNGTFDFGGVTVSAAGALLTNRVAITNEIIVRSFNNDPAKTIIRGAWDGTTNGDAAVRCVYIVSNASLIGFTLTNGATREDASGHSGMGGGILCRYPVAIISNCVLDGNLAYNTGGGTLGCNLYNCTLVRNGAQIGGAAASANMFNCTISSNYAWPTDANRGGAVSSCTLINCMLSYNNCCQAGGAQNSYLYNCLVIANTGYIAGVYISTGYNCTIVGNVGDRGGARACTLYNSIVYSNDGEYSNYFTDVVFSNSCTTPAKSGWAAGNITNNPMFISGGSGYGLTHVAGNYRLSRGSPCINAGANQWMTNDYDLDGGHRIRYGVVDMGVYENIHPGIIYNFR